MRWFWLLAPALLAACEPPLPARELPPLQTQRAMTRAPHMRVSWFPGEELVWQVHARSMPVGTAILTTDRGPRVRSRFVPAKWLSRMSSLHHDGVSGGQPKRDVHTLHSLIGWLRAWSYPSRRPASLQATFGKERYRVEVASPTLEAGEPGRLRIVLSARSRADGERIDASLWLENDPRRTPVRLDLRIGSQRITATLITDR